MGAHYFAPLRRYYFHRSPIEQKHNRHCKPWEFRLPHVLYQRKDAGLVDYTDRVTPDMYYITLFHAEKADQFGPMWWCSI